MRTLSFYLITLVFRINNFPIYHTDFYNLKTSSSPWKNPLYPPSKKWKNKAIKLVQKLHILAPMGGQGSLAKGG